MFGRGTRHTPQAGSPSQAGSAHRFWWLHALYQDSIWCSDWEVQLWHGKIEPALPSKICFPHRPRKRAAGHGCLGYSAD